MITGYLTVQDYLAAQWLHRKKPFLWWLVACCAAILIGVVMVRLHAKMPAVIFLSGGGGGLASLLTSTIVIPWKSRRIFAQHKDFAFPFTYTWDTTFLCGEGRSGTSKRAWSDYLRCKEDRHLFLLYHSDAIFEMLPKRWFQNPLQLEEFRALAASRK